MQKNSGKNFRNWPIIKTKKNSGKNFRNWPIIKTKKNSGKNFSENLVKELSRCFLTHFNTPPRREVVVGEYPPPYVPRGTS